MYAAVYVQVPPPLALHARCSAEDARDQQQHAWRRRLLATHETAASPVRQQAL
jgi:hypothetical protein